MIFQSRLFVLFIFMSISSCGISEHAIESASDVLNDTGIDSCSENFSALPGAWSSNIECALINWIGNWWGLEQDAYFGRDVLAASGTLKKIGTGTAGFDYTRLDHSGNPLEIQTIPWDDNGSQVQNSQWDCVIDNVTGLWWETKLNNSSALRYKAHTYTWYNSDPLTNGGDSGSELGGNCVGVSDTARCNTSSYVSAVNQTLLCGKDDWRIPTIEELLTLVQRGRPSIAIDQNHFLNTILSQWTWSSSPDPMCPTCAWDAKFDDGSDNVGHKEDENLIRLVRGLAKHR